MTKLDSPCVEYAIWGTATSPEQEEWVRSIGGQFEADDFVRVDAIADADFVLNMFDPAEPKAFRRASRGTYSAAFYELPEAPDDALKASYPMLVRTLSTLCFSACRVTASGSRRWSRARTRVGRPGGDLRASRAARDVASRDRQRVDPDLEPELWDGDEVTADISESAGASTSSTSFRLRSRSRITSGSGPPARHAPLLGRRPSYGNLSARKDETRFWMSASGVDKSKLESVGRDISW